jgi:hypothetical protein
MTTIKGFIFIIHKHSKSKDTNISSSCQRINIFPGTYYCSARRNLYNAPDGKWCRVLNPKTYKPFTFNQNC